MNCSCANEAECDHISGACVCKPGESPTKLHNKMCSIWYLHMRRISIILWSNLLLKTSSGWRGTFCSRPCPDGFWGMECRYQCDCDKGATCDPATGVCSCPPGKHGHHCSRSEWCLNFKIVIFLSSVSYSLLLYCFLPYEHDFFFFFCTVVSVHHMFSECYAEFF